MGEQASAAAIMTNSVFSGAGVCATGNQKLQGGALAKPIAEGGSALNKNFTGIGQKEVANTAIDSYVQVFGAGAMFDKGFENEVSTKIKAPTVMGGEKGASSENGFNAGASRNF